MNNPVISCSKLCKSYPQAGQPLEILKDIDLAIARGEKLAIVGPSGSGKTTLLHMLGGLDLPSSGSVKVAGVELASMSDKARSALRNSELGFVYQFHHLLGEFSALENVAMPLLIAGQSRRAAENAAKPLLERVGLGHRLSHRPAQLSGGERQRVAIARALVNQPACVLMDEPTGNLDRDNAESIHGLLDELNAEFDTSLVIVTHDPLLANRMQRVLRIEDGRVSELPATEPMAEQL
ncbi:lipoprotein-releasing ABC transporter ATP-binding protein LolD [Spongiibacter sp. KMU-158]|uniref:Lipoprotein-releasing system ATP-binding protein LolD n=1 Tax=Spongiibacter pelagi TaxID=2760804 RepID=A0A927GWL4_9GAMM|nr:lipoprotein-releasing ABC transporter ATP-binding protein LolD [Spongiibacter pelagi]MBD2859067.1 lipoprotein-releasing ABC transporter ATP-binding protein LolD [Spongiibacter pelagi]